MKHHVFLLQHPYVHCSFDTTQEGWSFSFTKAYQVTWIWEEQMVLGLTRLILLSQILFNHSINDRMWKYFCKMFLLLVYLLHELIKLCVIVVIFKEGVIVWDGWSLYSWSYVLCFTLNRNTFSITLVLYVHTFMIRYDSSWTILLGCTAVILSKQNRMFHEDDDIFSWKIKDIYPETGLELNWRQIMIFSLIIPKYSRHFFILRSRIEELILVVMMFAGHYFKLWRL